MVLTPGFEPGSHWWEESALHHAPLLPTSWCQAVDILRVVIFSKVPITFRAPNQIFKPNSKKIKVKPVYNGHSCKVTVIHKVTAMYRAVIYRFDCKSAGPTCR